MFLINLLLHENDVFCGVRGLQKNTSPQTSGLIIRKSILKTAKFVTHFLIVIGLLYLSALVFSHLEEQPHERTDLICERTQEKTNGIELDSSIIAFLRENHDDLTECDIEDVAMFVGRIKREKRLSNDSVHSNEHLNNVQKWFYFVLIATTTIGYGDVYPKTQNGKIFYCCFSVVGIILMMSLLKSCGAIITSINKRFNKFVRRYLCLGIKCWSEELLSVISTTLLFLVYLSLCVWHDTTRHHDTNHSIVDNVYFWIVSFTTVGFGDVGHSLQFEVEHVYELTMYRVFGLSLLAAVIKSLQSYIVVRKRTLQDEAVQRQRVILQKLHSSLLDSPLICGADAYAEEDYTVFNALGEVASISFNEADQEQK